ncbi:hypothetical protein, partial [Pseudomonas syringae]|uniref:hypothetical protein n=1 Tax=Pseudomonas syringae TaxID=317 RepID=UPI0034D63AD6
WYTQLNLDHNIYLDLGRSFFFWKYMSLQQPSAKVSNDGLCSSVTSEMPHITHLDLHHKN